MENKDFNCSFLVEQTPQQVFEAIMNVRGWWSEKLEGNSLKIDDEFSYTHGSLHYSKHKLTEVIPYKRVVWLTLESKLTFVSQEEEWNGTRMIFEIVAKGVRTKLNITHEGLLPSLQCFKDCTNGWTYYLQNSLLLLITTGKGNPDKQ